MPRDDALVVGVGAELGHDGRVEHGDHVDDEGDVDDDRLATHGGCVGRARAARRLVGLNVRRTAAPPIGIHDS